MLYANESHTEFAFHRLVKYLPCHMADFHFPIEQVLKTKALFNMLVVYALCTQISLIPMFVSVCPYAVFHASCFLITMDKVRKIITKK